MTGTKAKQDGGGLAVLVAVVQTAGSAIGSTGLDAWGYALLIVSGLLLSMRLRSPGTAIVLVSVAAVVYTAHGYPRNLILIAPVVAAPAAIRAGRHLAVLLSAAGGVAVWAVATHASAGHAWRVAGVLVGLVVLASILTAAAKALGRMDEEERRLRAERQRRQASEERLLIAAELHDVLGHHLSLINVRAAVGRRLLDRQPEEARIAFDTIVEASAEALREVRSVLDVLYPDGKDAPRAPLPRLEQLDALTADAGIPVSCTIEGTPRPLPAEVDRAAYRIVQEALTNVRRHAGAGASATVLIDYRDEEQVTVRIDDDGVGHRTAADSAGHGNGITGMRERAAALGGTLTAHPRLEGGWRVRAALPVPASDPEDAKPAGAAAESGETVQAVEGGEAGDAMQAVWSAETGTPEDAT